MNSRWSVPSRMWTKPSSTKRSAAWCQRGSRRTRPGLPWSSKARSALAGRQEAQRRSPPCRPMRARRGSIENRDRSERIGNVEQAGREAAPSSSRSGSGGRRRRPRGARAPLVRSRTSGRRRARRAPIDQRGRGRRRSSSSRLEVVDEPELGGVAQRRRRRGEVEVAGAAQRHVDLVHRPQRHAQQHVQRVALGLDEGLHAHVVGNVVGEATAAPVASSIERARTSRAPSHAAYRDRTSQVCLAAPMMSDARRSLSGETSHMARTRNAQPCCGCGQEH